MTFVDLFALRGPLAATGLALIVACAAAGEGAIAGVAKGRLRAGSAGKPLFRGQSAGPFLTGLATLRLVATAMLLALAAASAMPVWSVVLTFLATLGATALAHALGEHRAEPVLTLLAPLVWLARAAGGMVLWLRRAVLPRRAAETLDPDRMQNDLREDIAGAIVLGHSGGAMEKEDRDRLLGALDLSDRTVEEIMRHRRQIEMIDAATPPGDIIKQMLASPHSRLPVFRDDEENIVGVVHTKDLLREVDRLLRLEERSTDAAEAEGLQALDIVKVAMKPYFIPETTALDDQMRAFLARRTHFALVVDEYGSLQGLITLEDILEEIVGDITDEFDVINRNSALKRAENGDYLVDGAMTIRDLNRATDWQLPDDEANTLAGLVIHEAQMIPSQGQVFHFHGFRFEVAERRENRLTKLRMRPTRPL